MKATGKVVGGHTPQYYDNKEKQAELEKSKRLILWELFFEEYPEYKEIIKKYNKKMGK